MSTPSTPRTARSASPTANSPQMLTPGQKIKAMLAQFDSDSDSDNGNPQPQRSIARITDNLKNSTVSDHRPTMDLDDGASDEDDDIIMPKGRIAARLQAQGSENSESAFDRVSKSLRNAQQEKRDSVADEAMSEDDDDDDDDDDLPVAGPRRKANNRVVEEREESDADGSPSRARAFSPLFVYSPTRDDAEDQDGADGSDQDEVRPKANARFLALVAQKRKEREAKERIENEKKAAKAKQREQFSSEILSGDDSEGDDESERKLSQPARPARKASKKALEEMNRETQRLSRSMQLVHQAQTKKKISKESFFARFNFMQPDQQNASGSAPDNSSSTADSQNSSDAEAQKNKETPRTSPILAPSEKPSTGNDTNDASKEASTEFPTLEEMIAKMPQQSEQPIVGCVEEQATDKKPQAAEQKKQKKVLTMPPVRVRLSREQVARNQKDDSDSDLEIVTSPAKCRRYAVFENLPMRRHQESATMLKLKALAQLTSPKKKSSMNYAELAAHLLHQARQQASKERMERIEELRAKGVIIETADERAAMEDELENLVEKARKEAEEIAKKEKAAAKGEGDEDGDYEFSGSEEDGDEADEDEEEDDDEEEEGNEHGEKEGGLFDAEAGENEASDDGQPEVMSSEETGLVTQRRKRPTRVISDDEDEPPVPKTPAKMTNPVTVQSVERPHIPGLPSDDMTMSLTQAFAGTLGDNHADSQAKSTIPHSLPDPVDGRRESDSQMIIKDSQEQRSETTDILAGYAQSEIRVSESPAPRGMSQFSQIPDPTQDAGFVLSPYDPTKRFMSTPASTVETVLINRNESQNNSPTVQRKAKHLHRGRTTELSAIEEQSEGDFEIDASAFDVMKKAVKKKSSVPFDKNKSKAKDVVEEAAEESDDEYAGLGGASDEDDDVENAYDRQMIDDNSGETADEKQLAALNALHQRNADEKQVAKLLKDITTGALRRRRGGDDEFDLDDSDDELLARRREKQREFARMRKALMADEKIGEIAENPKKAAFFKAVEDRDMDDDDGLDFLEPEENPDFQEESSSQDMIPDSQPDTTTTSDSNKRKRPLEPSAEDINNRPPPHMRRKPASVMSKKPANLAEIRETLSFLTETPEYDSFHEDATVDDDEEQDKTIDGEAADEQPSNSQSTEEFVVPRHPRRTKGPVVDRLALLRQASSNSATSGSSNTRFAFQTGSGPDPIGFRPPLLRRTTTGSSSTSSSSKSDTSRRVTKPASGASVAKKGAVNYYTAAREKERERELRARTRNTGTNITALVNKHASNRLGALGRTGQWD
ncbi:MRC1-like domain-containing protein [Aspergillus caelatus]|uniref:MRC1-like domain-containing protein n=1 Tax=Aspergillus caelatus TaxID=61420 RepID=A0A5N6ZYD4_9EURO|nr:MRC1-like domain-containing protein [Aspergillus caelatus]KAE8361939.1 MRC1-like domain-containing protein [Aspergillus caelatus]